MGFSHSGPKDPKNHETGLPLAFVESHPNVAKIAPLGWGTRPLKGRSSTVALAAEDGLRRDTSAPLDSRGRLCLHGLW